MLGTVLRDRYRVEATLGEGGMGVVYRAHDTLLDRTVAIKALSPRLLGEEGLRRLLREAQAAAKLAHPNIVGVHDVIEDGQQRLIVMEYVEGPTLRERIPLRWPEAVQIAVQVCQALEYAHSHGVVHRDVKPENVMVTPQGTAKVMDFGLARSEGRSRLTQPGLAVGTVAYMAPEQALGGQVDGRSDLYSLGAVLYEAVTGRVPFAAEDPVSVISMHVNVPPVSPRFYVSEIPTVLEAAILRLLAKDPTERYASAAEAARVLQSALALADLEPGTPGAAEAPAAAEAAGGAASPLALILRGRLVGRREELATLKTALEAALSGRGQAVFLAGEPGIGKSRLGEELLVYARLRGCLALVGRCHEQDAAVPYLPLAEAVATAVAAVPDDQLSALAAPYAPEVMKLVPELALRLPAVPPSPALEPDQERLRLYRAVAAFLVALSRTRPLVLLLDDLHWADAATLQILRHLARQVRGERILILGAYRDVEVDTTHPLAPALSELNRERLSTRILIRGLPPDDVGEMIRAMFQAERPVSQEFRDLIYRETEGNPFFIEEVLKYLVETGALYIEEGGWQRKPIPEIDVPQSVREVVGRRLERVSEQCRKALALGAVVGRRFRFEILREVGDLEDDALLDALEEAVRAQVIREESAQGRVEYDFTHALIRDVLYERLSVRRRMTLHQRVGEALERAHAGRLDQVVEDLAHHFSRAPEGESLAKALRYTLGAAGKAARLLAHEEAVRYYERAADLLGDRGDERGLAEVWLAMGHPLRYLGRTRDAVAVFERALAHYEGTGAAAEAARVRGLIGHALQRAWQFAEAIPHLERALQTVGPEEHPRDVIRIHLDLARALEFSGQVDAAEEHARQALLLAQQAGAAALEAEAHASLGLVAARRLDLDTARGHNAETIRLARGTDEPEAYFTLTRALNNNALQHEVRGEYAEARALLEDAAGVARRARDLEQIAFLNLHFFWNRLWAGDWGRARDLLQENLRMPSHLPWVRLAESDLAMHAGDLETAIAANRALRDEARRAGNDDAAMGRGALLVWHLLETGRIASAAGAAAEYITLMERGPVSNLFWAATFLADALARGGDAGRAEVLTDRFEAWGRALRSPGIQGAAVYGRGVLALERGDLGAAVGLLEEALAHLRRQSPVLFAHALRTFVRTLRRRGRADDQARADEALIQGLEWLKPMGDAWPVQRVRAELGGG